MINDQEINARAHYVPVEDVARLLPGLRKTLASNPDAVVAITDGGEPALALLSWESWQELEDMAATAETMEILMDAEAMAALRQDQADFAAGTADTIPGDVAMQQLVADGLIDPANL